MILIIYLFFPSFLTCIYRTVVSDLSSIVFRCPKQASIASQWDGRVVRRDRLSDFKGVCSMGMSNYKIGWSLTRGDEVVRALTV
jgi:hypothetical protein